MQEIKVLSKAYRWPWYIVFLAMPFPMFLYVQNLGQVALEDLWKPLFFSVLIGVLIFGIAYFSFQKSRKAEVIAAIIEVFVFSYGHFYNLLKPVRVSGIVIGPHRYLVPLFALALGSLVWLVWAKLKDYKNLVKWISTLVMILFAIELI